MAFSIVKYRRHEDCLGPSEENEADPEVAEAPNQNESITQDNTEEESVKFVGTTVRYQMSGGQTSPWGRRSRSEKYLIILAGSLVAALTCMAIAIHSLSSQSKMHVTFHNYGHSSNDICLSKECVKVAASILSSMDDSADPCDDFYQYACGGWEKTHPVPDERTEWSSFEMLWEGNQLVMKTLIEQSNRSQTELSEAKRKVRDYYFSCMDEDGVIESRAGRPLIEVIHNTTGGWNITLNNGFDASKFDLQHMIHLVHNVLHVGGLFTWNVGENDKNSTQHIIQIDQGGLSLPVREYYLDDKPESKKIIDALETMILDVCKLLIEDDVGNGEPYVFPPTQIEEIRNQTRRIIEFETKIANFTIPASQRRSDTKQYHLIPVKELNELAPFLNWTMFLNDAFKDVQGFTISDATEVVVYVPAYLTNLSDLIMDYMQDDDGKRTLNDYFMWQLARTSRNTLSKKYRDAGRPLEKALMGKDVHQERWRYCITDTDSILGFALGAMFIRETFQGDSKLLAEKMISNIKQAFEKNIETLPWMDEVTRKRAIHKAEAITDMIGFPDFIMDEHSLNEKYQGFNVSLDDYFGNNVRYSLYSFDKNVRKIVQPVNRTMWSMTPPTVNAYYAPTKNQIVFPAGLLQPPFFNLDYPRSINYGAMGVVMGHELSHAFDDQGREYDENGNLRNWWNNKTLDEFEDRATCFENQYSSFEMDGEHVNGRQTLGENMADNGGLKAAFHAYTEWTQQQQADELPLPGLNLTHQQLFFLSFSQVWCSASTKQAHHLQMKDDPHSPSRFRVIGPLSNSKDFALAFGCPLNTTMNPNSKCEVW